jgi:hypothetical protein
LIQNRLLEVLGAADAAPFPAEQIDIEGLVVYLEAELAGQDAARLYPQTAQALTSSAAWRQEYAALKDFLTWEVHTPFVQPPRPPCFDFSYLPMVESATAVVTEPSWYWAPLGYLVVDLSNAVQRLLQPPQQQPAYSFIRAGQGEENAIHFALENQLADLNLRLTIEREPATSDGCQVIVEAEIPSRGGWPNLADTIVNLKQADTVVQSRLTDDFGKAVFPAVALIQMAGLKVEVIPGLPPTDPDHQLR